MAKVVCIFSDYDLLGIVMEVAKNVFDVTYDIYTEKFDEIINREQKSTSDEILILQYSDKIISMLKENDKFIKNSIIVFIEVKEKSLYKILKFATSYVLENELYVKNIFEKLIHAKERFEFINNNLDKYIEIKGKFLYSDREEPDSRLISKNDIWFASGNGHLGIVLYLIPGNKINCYSIILTGKQLNWLTNIDPAIFKRVGKSFIISKKFLIPENFTKKDGKFTYKVEIYTSVKKKQILYIPIPKEYYT